MIFLPGGRGFALVLGWLPFVVDGYMRLFFLFMPNFLYVFFWMAMAFTLTRYMQMENGRWLFFFDLSAGPVALAFGAYIMPMVMPLAKPEWLAAYYRQTGLNKSGDFKWEDQQMHPLPQDFADMIGWNEMAMKAGAVYNSLPAEEKAETMVFCRGYFSAGALNYYGKEVGLPEVYSNNASFLLWLPDTVNIKNLLLVGHHLRGKDDRVFQQFQKISVRDSVDIPLFRENGMKFILCEQGSDSLNTIIEKAIAAGKKRFGR
jgi:hypothetical protein